MKIKKLDSLRPGSREVERGRWEGQNFQLGSSAPGRRRRVGPRAGLKRVRKISPPNGIWSPNRPASSESLYRLRYPGSCTYTYAATPVNVRGFAARSRSLGQFGTERKCGSKTPYCYCENEWTLCGILFGNISCKGRCENAVVAQHGQPESKGFIDYW